MKKLKQAGFVLLAVLFAAVFCGCAEDSDNVPRSAQGGDMETLNMEDYPYELGSFEGLDAETEWQILKDFFKSKGVSSNFTINDYSITGYYGTYNGYIVVGITLHVDNPMIPAVMYPPKIIADWYVDQFFFFETTVWKNEQVYSITELYNHGELTLDDLRSIANIHPAWRPIDNRLGGKR